jgi:hypothetical protein
LDPIRFEIGDLTFQPREDFVFGVWPAHEAHDLWVAPQSRCERDIVARPFAKLEALGGGWGHLADARPAVKHGVGGGVTSDLLTIAFRGKGAGFWDAAAARRRRKQPPGRRRSRCRRVAIVRGDGGASRCRRVAKVRPGGGARVVVASRSFTGTVALALSSRREGSSGRRRSRCRRVAIDSTNRRVSRITLAGCGYSNNRVQMRRFVSLLLLLAAPALFAATRSADLQVSLPLFPPNNWWNTDISSAPVDPNSAAFISFIGTNRGMHPDFGGDAGGGDVYGFPVIRVEGTQPKKTVDFIWWPEQSDGVDHTTETPYPFYPVPPEAITQTGWVEGGQPGNVDQRDDADRHILIVDETNNRLYELYNVWWNGTQWEAGSGAHWYMNRNDRRPDTWTSADAAGLAILPGLVRWDEVNGPGEIRHAFRVTVRATNGYVYPASHRAGSTNGALPMGARLRLKANKDISQFAPSVQKIFRAMKRYGLIVADNGSDMYVSGTYDTRWDNDILNPAFSAIKASDFEVIQLGWAPSVALVATLAPSMKAGKPGHLTVTAYDANGNVATAYRGTVQFTSTDTNATLPATYTFTAADAGKRSFPSSVTFNTQGRQVLSMKDTVTPAITGSLGVNVLPVQPIQQQIVWTCFHYGTRGEADNHMASRNDDATLVSTGDATWPFVVVERWQCDFCTQVPEPQFIAFPRPAGYTPTPTERVVTGVDGTELVVRKRVAPGAIEAVPFMY